MILELVGGANLASNLTRLATQGRVAVMGAGAGARAEGDLALLMRKRGRIHGSMLRSRSIVEKAQVIDSLAAFLVRRPLRVPVEETFPLARTQDAYERFAAGNKFGKIVVCP